MRRILLVGILLWGGCKNAQQPPPLVDMNVPGANIKVDPDGNVGVRQFPGAGDTKVSVEQNPR